MPLPLMLAGPILRRVEPKLVAVWVALSRPATVKLSLYQGMKVGAATAVAHVEMSTPVAALRIGEALFVALATLKITAPTKVLQPGINYAYDLEIVETPSGAKHTLHSLGLLARVFQQGVPGVNVEPLGYAAGLLPSLVLPPAALTDLRMVYGSCRRPCNEHADAMVWIDTLIERARPAALAGNPGDAAALAEFAKNRPHQMFLGGDQIYADDVSPIHLAMCNRLGHEMLSGSAEPLPAVIENLTITGRRKPLNDTARPRFKESLRLGFEPPPETQPVPPPPAAAPLPEALPATLANFPAGGRLDLSQIDAQMTSTDGDSHLLGFGEYAAMHLMVWSNATWTADRWPSHVSIAEAPGSATGANPGLNVNTPFDIALAEFLEPDLQAWHDESGPKRFGPGAASVLRRNTLVNRRGFEDYKKLEGVLKRLFKLLMAHLQARLLRALAERVGITKLGDAASVRTLGNEAMSALAAQRRRTRSDNIADAWRILLDKMVAGSDATTPAEAQAAAAWTQFVKTSLAVRRDARDEDLSVEVDTPDGRQRLLDVLVARWTDEPPDGNLDAHAKDGYSNLGRSAVARRIESLATGKVWGVYRRLNKHREMLQIFERGLPRVRRAMANVPTYMIFDDHDVTDDWNLNPRWCERVLKNERGLGRQLVRNALAAYALFQDWGNDPVRYESGTPANLLANVAALFGSTSTLPRPDAGATRALDGFLGLDKQPTLINPPKTSDGYKPIDAPMKFHFRIGGPKHLVVALDNRTRRSFVSMDGPPGNVAISMQADQIPAAPLTEGRELLVVVAPLQVLAPSIFDELIAPAAYRAFDAIKRGGPGDKGRGFANMAGTDPDAIEGWALDTVTFEALLERLAPHRQVLFLSGDVHYSAATQMSYWRKADTLPARFIQFTSSGFKNVMPVYIQAIDRSLAFAQQMVRSDIGGERLGWKAGAAGAFDFPPGKDETDLPHVLRKRLRRKPAHLPTYGWPIDREATPPVATTVKATLKPDFSWRLSPVFDLRPDAERPEMARPAPFVGTPPADAKFASAGQPFEAYRQVADRHQRQLDRLGNSRQLLFRSNFGLVRFESRNDTSGASPRTVLEAVHEIYTAVPNPDALDPRERAEPKLQSDPTPFAYVVQRAALTPDPAEPRPEDRPLKGGLAESLLR